MRTLLASLACVSATPYTVLVVGDWVRCALIFPHLFCCPSHVPPQSPIGRLFKGPLHDPGAAKHRGCHGWHRRQPSSLPGVGRGRQRAFYARPPLYSARPAGRIISRESSQSLTSPRPSRTASSTRTASPARATSPPTARRTPPPTASWTLLRTCTLRLRCRCRGGSTRTFYPPSSPAFPKAHPKPRVSESAPK